MLSCLWSLFATTLAVVVLCNAYRETAPEWLLAAARGEGGKARLKSPEFLPRQAPFRLADCLLSQTRPPT